MRNSACLFFSLALVGQLSSSLAQDGTQASSPVDVSVVPMQPQSGVFVVPATLRPKSGEVATSLPAPAANSIVGQGPEAMKFYEATFFISGELLRASMVCGGDWKRTVEISIGLIANPEMKALSNGFPKLTKRWLNDGATNFNNGVMTSGVAQACAAMENTRAKAEELLARRR